MGPQGADALWPGDMAELGSFALKGLCLTFIIVFRGTFEAIVLFDFE